MKHRNRRRERSSPFVDPEFARVLTGGIDGGESHSRQAERKARQFCRQVQRALNLALAERGEEGLEELFVDDVTPAPDCGHLLVHVAVPRDRAVGEALAALRASSGRLRSEVAKAITRKRAPELSFVPAAPQGGENA